MVPNRSQWTGVYKPAYNLTINPDLRASAKRRLLLRPRAASLLVCFWHLGVFTSSMKPLFVLPGIVLSSQVQGRERLQGSTHSDRSQKESVIGRNSGGPAFSKQQLRFNLAHSPNPSHPTSSFWMFPLSGWLLWFCLGCRASLESSFIGLIFPKWKDPGLLFLLCAREASLWELAFSQSLLEGYVDVHNADQDNVWVAALLAPAVAAASVLLLRIPLLWKSFFREFRVLHTSGARRLLEPLKLRGK